MSSMSSVSSLFGCSRNSMLMGGNIMPQQCVKGAGHTERNTHRDQWITQGGQINQRIAHIVFAFRTELEKYWLRRGIHPVSVLSSSAAPSPFSSSLASSSSGDEVVSKEVTTQSPSNIFIRFTVQRVGVMVTSVPDERAKS
ncbi:hypothetical protein TYRP_021314 [Tyrophagus putrescentiae]|nr:hypothetical protein TYRP_021314 [Tyrophagus putrescentiae]